GAFWFGVMGLLVKLSGRRLPSQQIVVFRAAATLVLSWWAVRAAGVRPALGEQRGLLLLRGLFGAVGINCFYYSLVHLPLGEATLIQFMNPVFATVLAAVWVGERIRAGEVAALVASLLGVVFITRPAVLFGTESAAIAPAHAAIALLGAVCSGAAYATVRKLGPREHPAVVVLYLPLVTLPLVLPFTATQWTPPTGTEWMLLAGVAVSTQLAQVFMTRGLQAETAVRATTTGYLQIVFAGAWGALLLGETPSAWTLAGAAVIVASTLTLALGRTRVSAAPDE
ncbi:MAG TPA: DMT family transporter, partial [Gemmatimonadales bacterium]|nr:DMT family transporter [Gemmatimonadales bacterium]